MKKLFAITLLIVHLFYSIGHPVLFGILIRQSDKDFSPKIDRHQYDDNELVEIKVALNAPYMTAWSGYQRCDGDITIGGVYHNYVKRKISGDTLYLLCIPNQERTKLNLAKNNVSKKINDFSAGKKAEENSRKADLFNPYQEEDILYSVYSPLLSPIGYPPTSSASLSFSFIERHGKPPEVNS